MMRYRKILMCAALLLAAACEDPETIPDDIPVGPDIPLPVEAAITIPAGYEAIFTEGITAPEEEQTYEIKFNATKNWGTDIAYDGPDGWLSILPTRGSAGDVDMTVSLSANEAEDARSCTVTIACDTVCRSIRVTQLGVRVDPGPGPGPGPGPEPEDPGKITIAEGFEQYFEDNVSFNAQAHSFAVKFNANKAWTALVKCSFPDGWVSVRPGEGEAGDVEMTVDVDKNEEEYGRYCDIVIKCQEDSVTISILQDGAEVDPGPGPGPGPEDPEVIPATGMHLYQRELTMVKGETATLTAIITPEDATDTEIEWSTTNWEVVDVDQEGHIEAKGPGTAVVTAELYSSSGVLFTSSCTITVIIPVEKVTVFSGSLPDNYLVANGRTYDLNPGDEIYFWAELWPEDATETEIAWEFSAPGVASLSNGTLTALALGSTTVTVSAGGQSATFYVNVKEPDPEVSVKLTPKEMVLFEGESAVLNVEITPSYILPGFDEDAYDHSIVQFASGGKVTALKAGTTILVCEGYNPNTSSMTGVKDTCYVRVVARVETAAISLDRTELSLQPGQSATLHATTTPAGSSDHVVWRSTNEAVAKVKDGKVTAVAAGTALIYATAGGVSALCTVTVSEPVAVTAIKLDKVSATVEKGKTLQLTATVEPKNATGVEFTWTSSNDTVVTVSPDGLLTGVAVGKATITISCGSVRATCAVEVTESDIEGVDDGGETNW
ncbi:MAG: Ig-like domain-containing protein [Bacteroidales bacterium]|nr:Ig-like domain-containing protein [Bacteroidales bacterium]